MFSLITPKKPNTSTSQNLIPTPSTDYRFCSIRDDKKIELAIGKLAAIAIFKTALNYFLELELKHIHTIHPEEFKKESIVLPETRKQYLSINNLND